MSITENDIELIEKSILKKIKKTLVILGVITITTAVSINMIKIKKMEETQKEIIKNLNKISKYIEEAR